MSDRKVDHYHVFISHSGFQKGSFCFFLYEELKSRFHGKLKVFLDEVSLEGGDRNVQKMNTAMHGCDLVVLILSPEFLSNAKGIYSMQELLHLHWRRQRNNDVDNVIIIPVFYGIDFKAAKALALAQWPSVRSDALPLCLNDLVLGCDVCESLPGWQHSDRLSAEEFEAAVTEVMSTTTCIRDDQVRNDYERVQRIAQDVAKQLSKAGKLPEAGVAVALPDILLGIDAKQEEVVNRLRQQHMLVLYGPGGIGKSTLADAVFSHLQQTHFVGNPRACYRFKLSEGSDIEKVLNRALHHITGSASDVDVDTGRRDLQRHMQQQEMLLLVDNPTEEQLQELVLQGLGEHVSMILVTSRDENITCSRGRALPGYKVETLQGSFPKQLFCAHAGIAEFSPMAESKAVADIINFCKGLPLALILAAKTFQGIDDRSSFSVDQLGDKLFGVGLEKGNLFNIYGYSILALPNLATVKLLLEVVLFLHGFTAEQIMALGYEKEHLDRLMRFGLVDLEGGMEVVTVHDTLTDFCKFWLETVSHKSCAPSRQQQEVTIRTRLQKLFIASMNKDEPARHSKPALAAEVFQHHQEIQLQVLHSAATADTAAGSAETNALLLPRHIKNHSTALGTALQDILQLLQPAVSEGKLELRQSSYPGMHILKEVSWCHIHGVRDVQLQRSFQQSLGSNLRVLVLEDLADVAHLDLQAASKLQHLTLRGIRSLVQVTANLSAAAGLKYLQVTDCPSLHLIQSTPLQIPTALPTAAGGSVDQSGSCGLVKLRLHGVRQMLVLQDALTTQRLRELHITTVAPPVLQQLQTTSTCDVVIFSEAVGGGKASKAHHFATILRDARWSYLRGTLPQVRVHVCTGSDADKEAVAGAPVGMLLFTRLHQLSPSGSKQALALLNDFL